MYISNYTPTEAYKVTVGVCFLFPIFGRGIKLDNLNHNDYNVNGSRRRKSTALNHTVFDLHRLKLKY